MSHVIARHADIREDQARRVALVSRVVQDVLSDPETGALALAVKDCSPASPRPNSRLTRSGWNCSPGRLRSL
jgi:hypothetical protein